MVGEPALLLECAADEAQRRGYRVIDLGSHVQGDVDDVVAHFTAEIVSAMRVGDRFCVVGVGEVTVQVVGTGSGGRCQELAWRMARPMAELGGEGVFVAQSSDGRDFIENVSGAWVDSSTLGRAEAHSVSWSQTVADNDSHTALLALGQLIEGGHTGWNLCDLYVGLFDSSGAQ